jgi:GNAT superfamily N-acetyltransferase
MIQLQHWGKSGDRILITYENLHASVQVDLFPNIEKYTDHYKADCLLWALWVDGPYREQGAAKMLVARAELEAKQHGCKSIALEWSADESEEWVLQWYDRLGYNEVEFGKGSSLMVKEL